MRNKGRAAGGCREFIQANAGDLGSESLGQHLIDGSHAVRAGSVFLRGRPAGRAGGLVEASIGHRTSEYGARHFVRCPHVVMVGLVPRVQYVIRLGGVESFDKRELHIWDTAMVPNDVFVSRLSR